MKIQSRILILSEEQKMIRESALRLLDEEFPFSVRQKLSKSETGFDAEHWKLFAEMGWLGINLPETLGGLGGSLVDASLIYQQMGRTLVRSPYLTTLTGLKALTHFTNGSGHTDTLKQVVSGNRMLTCGLSETENPGHPAQTRLEENKDQWRLNGCKRLVPWAGQSDDIIISAIQKGEHYLLIVNANSPGVRKLPYRMYDGSRTADIEFSNVEITENCILGAISEADIQKLLDIETAMMCMEASACMWAIQDQTLEFMKTREQFGQPLSTLQALQHRIVDVYVKCQLAQSMAEDAILAAESICNNSDSDFHNTKRISAAKAFIGEAGRIAGKEGIQLHGGIGMTDDMPIGHYFKRLTTFDRLNGDASWHRRRFSG